MRGLVGPLRAYRHAADQAFNENASLLSRLADTFQYVGTVNIKNQEIQSVLGGIECSPQSRRERQQCLAHLTAKAMAIIDAPWGVIRIIDCRGGRTLSTLGNRDILGNRRIENRAKVISRPKKTDLLAVCIFSDQFPGDAERLLLTAILNQCLMLFLLRRCDCFQPSKKSLRGVGESGDGGVVPAPEAIETF